MLKRAAEPWLQHLECVRGTIGEDGIERISTQALFDALEWPRNRRTAGSCRKLAKLMRELGWSPTKARGLNRGGYRDQIRGYARQVNRGKAL